MLRLFVLFLAACAPAAASTETVVARVGSEQIKSTELDKHLRDELTKLDREYAKNRYEARKKGLEAIVFRKLVEVESKRLNIDPEAFIDRELDLRLKVATVEEARVFFDDNKARLGNVDFDEVKERIVDYMTTQRRSEAILALFAELKKKTEVVLLLDPPRADRKNVDTTGPSMGAADAAVVIVEYSDFQCPYCSRARMIVDQVLALYRGKVRVVFRHFPLPFHDKAVKAAEAAECAQDQGKFWAMHDHMFEHQNELEVAQLKTAARTVGLDGGAFDACLDDSRHRPKVEQSVEAARALGVEGTPHFFINGIEMTGAQPLDKFKDVIEAELQR